MYCATTRSPCESLRGTTGKTPLKRWTLAACLQATLPEGYATENRCGGCTRRPGRRSRSRGGVLHRRGTRSALARTLLRPVMLAVCRTAVGTGLRFGELAVLRWSDVHLL